MRGTAIFPPMKNDNSPANEKTARAARRRARANWPVRKFRLGEEPADDFSAFTVEERLAMTWQMTCDAWASAGRPLPVYSRSEMPIRVVQRQRLAEERERAKEREDE